MKRSENIVILCLLSIGLSLVLISFANAEIDLLQYAYDAQYKELIRRAEIHPDSKAIKDLIFSINTVSQKYKLIAPQIKIYSNDIATQYLVVVNLMEQLIERETNKKE